MPLPCLQYMQCTLTSSLFSDTVCSYFLVFLFFFFKVFIVVFQEVELNVAI